MKRIFVVAFLLLFSLSCSKDRVKSPEIEENIAVYNRPEHNIGKEVTRDRGDAIQDSNSLRANSSANKTDTNQLNVRKGVDVEILSTSNARNKGESKFSFFTMNFWAFLSIFLLAIIFFVLSRTNNSKISRINRKIKNLEDKYLYQNTQQLSSQKITIHPQVEKQIKEVTERLNRLESAHSTNEKGSIEAKPNVIEWKVNDDPNPKRDEQVVFYMATPSADKEFHIKSKSETFRPTQSLYKFFVDKSGEKGEFEFYSDERGLKESTNSPHIYIEPVCEAQNAHNPNAKRIITIANGRGKAEKQGDKWIVTQKAKIKYE